MKLPRIHTLEEIAAILGCQYTGDPAHPVSGLNEIHKVEAGDITFVDVAKYYSKALSSAATTVIINQPVEPPAGKGLLISEDPFRDYNLLTEHFQPRKSLDTAGTPRIGEGVKIGRNVVFGEDVVLEDGVEIGHNAVIGSHVRIGAGSLIHANVTLYDHCLIGRECCINAGTVIGGGGVFFQSRRYVLDKMIAKGRVVIGDHVDIGANCTIDRGVSGDTVIGDWTKLDNLVMIGHDTVVGKKCLIAAQVGVAGVVIIEDEVIL